jgi:hypothetical protein
MKLFSQEFSILFSRYKNHCQKISLTLIKHMNEFCLDISKNIEFEISKNLFCSILFNEYQLSGTILHRDFIATRVSVDHDTQNLNF